MATRCPAFAATAAAAAARADGGRLPWHAPPLVPCRSPPHAAVGARRRRPLLLQPPLMPTPAWATVASPTRGLRMASGDGGGGNVAGDAPGVVSTPLTADAEAAPHPPPPPRPVKPTYSQATRLREETEAPFRKARMFVFGASAASAGVGGLVAASRVIAAAVGVRGVQPLDETLPNVCVYGGGREDAHQRGDRSTGLCLLCRCRATRRGLSGRGPVWLVGWWRVGCLAA